MRKRLAALLLSLLLLGGIAAGAAAGGADDPLLSLSFLYNTVLPRLSALFTEESESRFTALKEEFGRRLDAVAFPALTDWERSAGYVPLTLEDGGSVTLAPFGKFLLTEGLARLRIQAGEVLDITDGRLCADGEWLSLNHRYFAAEDSRAVIRIYSENALGFVDGDHLWESTGAFDVSEQFLDIETHWGRDYILHLAAAGLVNGMDTHAFEPDRKVTRGMFVTVLGRMSGVSESFWTEPNFSDVAEKDWFGPYVCWAAQSGIVEGYDEGIFAPYLEITREQTALILVRYCGAFELHLPEMDEGEGFADEEQVSPWALESVRLARRYGLVNGKEGGLFDPLGTVTRAEMCAVIDRLMEKMALNSVSEEEIIPEEEPPEVSPLEDGPPEEQAEEELLDEGPEADEEPPEKTPETE